MERYGHYGLLRSMVVHPGYRNKHIAAKLVSILEQTAASSGITSIFLLTETAADYFERKGYHTITRDEVPGDLMGSTEFSHVCPQTAIVMKKIIR
jgi:amino-acid N-acetyltransferase